MACAHRGGGIARRRYKYLLPNKKGTKDARHRDHLLLSGGGGILFVLSLIIDVV
jgi:hypothetical protein